HIQQKVPWYPVRKQPFLLVGPIGPNEHGPRSGQRGSKGRDSVSQRVVLIPRLSLAHVNLEPAPAECEPRQNDRGEKVRIVEILIKLLSMRFFDPFASIGEARTHVGDRIEGQREIVVLARHQRDGSLARSITGVRQMRLQAEEGGQGGAGLIEISAFQAREAAAGGYGAYHVGVAEG